MRERRPLSAKEKRAKAINSAERQTKSSRNWAIAFTGLSALTEAAGMSVPDNSLWQALLSNTAGVVAATSWLLGLYNGAKYTYRYHNTNDLKAKHVAKLGSWVGKIDF